MDRSPPPLPADSPARPPVHAARGWLLVFLGVGLSGAMAYLGAVLHAVIVRNGEPGSHSHWNGSAQFTRTVFELFGAVFVFGLVTIAAGIYVLRTRRTSRVLAVVMVGLALAMGYLGYAIAQTRVPG